MKETLYELSLTEKALEDSGLTISLPTSEPSPNRVKISYHDSNSDQSWAGFIAQLADIHTQLTHYVVRNIRWSQRPVPSTIHPFYARDPIPGFFATLKWDL